MREDLASSTPRLLLLSLVCGPLLVGCPQVLSDDFISIDVRQDSATAGEPWDGNGAAAGGSAGWGELGGNNDGSPPGSPSGGEFGLGGQDAGPSGSSGSGAPTCAPDDCDTSSAGAGGQDTDCVPEDEVCDGIDNNCDEVVDDGACDADCRGFVANGSSYMYCGEATPHAEVLDRCAQQGMRPIDIESEAENEAIVSAAAPLDAELGEPNGKQRAFWTGASDEEMEGTWVWLPDGPTFWIGTANGAPVGGLYSNWGQGRPNDVNQGEDCGLVYIENGEEGPAGEWNDVVCDDGYSFVCEAP